MNDSLSERLLGGLGQAVLDALPGPGGLVDADGTLVVVNERWRNTPLSHEVRGLGAQPGDNLLVGLGALRERLPDAEAMLAVDGLLTALARVLRGDSTREQVSIAHLQGYDGLTQFTFSSLPHPTGGALVLVADRDEHNASDERLAIALTHDRLTALPNRTLFIDRVASALMRPNRGDVAVIHLDLDRFRLVNSLVGPAKGDEVLALLARRLAGMLHAGESAGRVGDDAFAIVSEALVSEGEAVAFGADRKSVV